MNIIIDHERYGGHAEFESLGEAEACLRGIRPGTLLEVRADGKVLDDLGDVVGRVPVDLDGYADDPTEPLDSHASVAALNTRMAAVEAELAACRERHAALEIPNDATTGRLHELMDQRARIATALAKHHARN